MSSTSDSPPAPFVVGASRSGTTLLRLMLDAHSELSLPPETHFIPAAAGAWSRSASAAQCLETITASERWPDLGLGSERFLELVERVPELTLSDLLRAIYSAYANERGKRRWGDKTPWYVLRMPLIAELLPEARFVHMIRDGRDVALSVLPLWFGPDSIEEAARWWVERISTGRRDGGTVAYLEVRYEQLVEQPREQLRRVCDFIELESEEQQLLYHVNAAERMSEMRDIGDSDHLLTASERATMRSRQRARLSDPPHMRSVGRWRTEMSREQLRAFEAIAGDTLEKLGYPLSRSIGRRYTARPHDACA